jgi:lactase-phlorizin hydrolase
LLILGQVSIVLNSEWYEPKNPSNPKDIQAAETALQYQLGWFANPIYINGDYPEVMKEHNKVNRLKYPNMMELIPFTEQEKAKIYGKAG